MKPLLTTIAITAFAAAAFSADYSVFKVCEDQHVIRTSDGAEAGHIEYIVLEPSSHRVVTTIVSGGVVGDRLIPVPADSLTYSGSREVTLTQITRERLVSAPVIERTQITTTAAFQPALIERSYTHFGARFDAVGTSTSRTSTDVNVNGGAVGAAREQSITSTTVPGSSTTATGTVGGSQTTTTDRTSSTQPPSSTSATGSVSGSQSTTTDATTRGSASADQRSMPGRAPGDTTNSSKAPAPVGERLQDSKDRTSQQPPQSDAKTSQTESTSGGGTKATDGDARSAADREAQRRSSEAQGESGQGKSKAGAGEQSHRKASGSDASEEKEGSKASRKESKSEGTKSEAKSEEGSTKSRGKGDSSERREEGSSGNSERSGSKSRGESESGAANEKRTRE